MSDNNQNNHEVINVAKDLMARKSVTPEDAGCQDMMAARLEKIGFNIESMVFEDTTNMWARKGDSDPVFCFAGHTDVVPSGPESEWHTPPFEPVEMDGYLHGRGAADMKGSLAAMIVATERFVEANPNHKGSIAFLITSDEEGPFINGTTRVVDTLEARNEKMTWALVGEPSSTNKVGDVIKNGRRGSLSGDAVIKGVQGHVAYPHLAKNPVHLASPVIAELSQIKWDEGNDYFPPTSFQVSNISAGTGATNVVPGEMKIAFNFRYSTEVTADELMKRVEGLFDAHGLEYNIDWTYNGLPFLTEPGDLVNAAVEAVEEAVHYKPELLTTGGTSDGRFIAPTGAQVLELGPCNATIHKINECVKMDDLIRLTDMYQGILQRLLASK